MIWIEERGVTSRKQQPDGSTLRCAWRRVAGSLQIPSLPLLPGLPGAGRGPIRNGLWDSSDRALQIFPAHQFRRRSGASTAVRDRVFHELPPRLAVCARRSQRRNGFLSPVVIKQEITQVKEGPLVLSVRIAPACSFAQSHFGLFRMIRGVIHKAQILFGIQIIWPNGSTRSNNLPASTNRLLE